MIFELQSYHIAINLCRDHARSKAWRQAAATFSISAPRPDSDGSDNLPETDLRSPGPAPDECAMTREDLRALESAIQSLPHSLRAALVLTAIEGRSQADAAQLLGTTAKAVETRVSRARSHLARILGRGRKQG